MTRRETLPESVPFEEHTNVPEDLASDDRKSDRVISRKTTAAVTVAGLFLACGGLLATEAEWSKGWINAHRATTTEDTKVEYQSGEVSDVVKLPRELCLAEVQARVKTTADITFKKDSLISIPYRFGSEMTGRSVDGKPSKGALLAEKICSIGTEMRRDTNVNAPRGNNTAANAAKVITLRVPYNSFIGNVSAVDPVNDLTYIDRSNFAAGAQSVIQDAARSIESAIDNTQASIPTNAEGNQSKVDGVTFVEGADYLNKSCVSAAAQQTQLGQYIEDGLIDNEVEGFNTTHPGEQQITARNVAVVVTDAKGNPIQNATVASLLQPVTQYQPLLDKLHALNGEKVNNVIQTFQTNNVSTPCSVPTKLKITGGSGTMTEPSAPASQPSTKGNS